MMEREVPERVALFGGGGFIESHFTRRLIDKCELEVIDIASEKLDDTLKHPNLTFHQLDISDPSNDKQCREIIEESDLVVFGELVQTESDL